MTRQQRREHKALEAVRWAIKGWAFVSRERLADYIAHGDRAVSKLPDEFRAAGHALVEPLREALSN